MITSTLSQLHWYKIMSPHFAKAIDFALTTDLASLPVGKHEIDGENVFGIINEYSTKPISECDWESHLKYADIQVLIFGSEKFGYSPLNGQEPSVPYQPENDVILYPGSVSTGNEVGKDASGTSAPGSVEASGYITLNAGGFIIFFPTDLHQPELFIERPEPVKKLVLKVKV
ncbi:YhcH/YjgK/YiaL family protein [Flavitalea flava]